MKKTESALFLRLLPDKEINSVIPLFKGKSLILLLEFSKK